MTDTITTGDDTKPLNRRQHSKVMTAKRVLTAARTLFEEVGYVDATIRDIAKAAKMSTGAVFANYQDKAALYRAAMGHDPVTPEQGARAIAELKAALGEDTTAYADAILRIFQVDVPEELQEIAAGGIPWREYERGADGELVDVTALPRQ